MNSRSTIQLSVLRRTANLRAVVIATRVIYDSPVVKDLIIFQYILPYFSKKKDTIITDLYDVLITIQKDESTLDNATFRFDIECQLSDICQKFGRFRVESGKTGLSSIGTRRSAI